MQAAEKAWTDAIAIDPSNPNAWSNRGTSRLQFGRWQDARDDLQKALELESRAGEPSGVSRPQFHDSALEGMSWHSSWMLSGGMPAFPSSRAWTSLWYRAYTEASATQLCICSVVQAYCSISWGTRTVLCMSGSLHANTTSRPLLPRQRLNRWRWQTWLLQIVN